MITTDDMNTLEAVAIIKAAVKYSVRDFNNMNNAFKQTTTLSGWKKDEAPIKFVEYCLLGFKLLQQSKKTYILHTGDKAEMIAVFVDKLLGEIIEDTLYAKRAFID